MKEKKEIEIIETTSEKTNIPEKERWDNYVKEAEEQVPNRLEDAAKFLATIVSFALTLFLSLSGGQKDFSQYAKLGWVKGTVYLWLFSAIFAFLVIFPWTYRYVESSMDEIKKMHKRIVKTKRTLLITGLFLFLLGLGILVFVFTSGI